MMQSLLMQARLAVLIALLSEVTQGHMLSQVISRMKRERVDGYNYGLSSADIRAIMDVHTQQRQDVVPGAANMQFMTWNTVLANTAQNYACQCVEDSMLHNSQREEQSAGFETVGESIFSKAGSWNPDDQPAGGVTHWFSEVDAFTFISGEQGTCDGPCGHYTQGVWHDSVEIGCGYARCNAIDLCLANDRTDCHRLVCNYAPGGNTNTQPPFEDGSPCSNCPEGWTGGCAFNQCTRDGGRCGDIACSNGGTLDADMCLCDCLDGFYGAFCEQSTEDFEAICAADITDDDTDDEPGDESEENPDDENDEETDEDTDDDSDDDSDGGGTGATTVASQLLVCSMLLAWLANL